MDFATWLADGHIAFPWEFAKRKVFVFVVHSFS